MIDILYTYIRSLKNTYSPVCSIYTPPTPLEISQRQTPFACYCVASYKTKHDKTRSDQTKPDQTRPAKPPNPLLCKTKQKTVQYNPRGIYIYQHQHQSRTPHLLNPPRIRIRIPNATSTTITQIIPLPLLGPLLRGALIPHEFRV